MNQFVIADSSKCIGCRTCEIACAVAHAGRDQRVLSKTAFFPRLKVIKSANVSMPVLCHQCENAPCASVCPHDALIRHRDSIQVIQSRWIGCKSCVIACPFGAIDVVSTHSQSENGTTQTGSEVHKCDLCVDVADSPSCVRVCPTSALTLVTQQELHQKIAAKQQQSAWSQADIRLS
ncbi:4Fe-4S dicluster domain-containing protein [Musicola paradisiaca]|uniref:4Fe-4S ferredoxin iron-sulfur binding domain protein n=1 Tax=Musicola paradisiaca (strain Ech703) TaxID=579405 RepID=C6C755_MUSP7|nr:4Fe-4S dicluster domain-containing protein [Musicola paradisiaca]ACS87762.1 4Fe-4S ferredoxin iron-sulfur binding domain protein [Musicola paradisiaca Ech703]